VVSSTIEDFIIFVLCTVKISIKARKVTIEGPRGKIVKDLSHMSIDLRVMKMATPKMKGLYVRIQMWNGGYKQACAVTTFKSIVGNCIIGVTEVSYNSHFSRKLHDHKMFCFGVSLKKLFSIFVLIKNYKS